MVQRPLLMRDVSRLVKVLLKSSGTGSKVRLHRSQLSVDIERLFALVPKGFLSRLAQKGQLGAALLIIYAALGYKLLSYRELNNLTFFGVYSLLITIFLVFRYTFSLRHVSGRYGHRGIRYDRVTVVIPAYNEGSAIYDTIRAVTEADYDHTKLTIVVVNDGSKDDTHDWIERAIADFAAFSIRYVNKLKNEGKREGMFDGFIATDDPYVVYVDSDSIVDKKCIKELLKPFYTSPDIAAVSGHAFVTNADDNSITQMQEVRYFNAFRAIKASESLLGYVMCCSGCCSAYRRSALDEVMGDWIKQSFLGQKCTYGDDRSLTNMVMRRGYKAVYNQNAITYTNVPDTYAKYRRQQLRWKKSWVRESLIQLKYAHKKSIAFALLSYFSILLPLFSPIVLLRYIVYFGIKDPRVALLHVIGIVFSSLLAGVYYRAYNPGRAWLKGTLVFTFVNLSLSWQLPYVFFKLKDTRWGTR